MTVIIRIMLQQKTHCGNFTFAANPMQGKYYEGDMILPDGDSKVTTLDAGRWPDGVVHYELDGSCGKKLSPRSVGRISRGIPPPRDSPSLPPSFDRGDSRILQCVPKFLTLVKYDFS